MFQIVSSWWRTRDKVTFIRRAWEIPTIDQYSMTEHELQRNHKNTKNETHFMFSFERDFSFFLSPWFADWRRYWKSIVCCLAPSTAPRHHGTRQIRGIQIIARPTFKNKLFHYQLIKNATMKSWAFVVSKSWGRCCWLCGRWFCQRPRTVHPTQILNIWQGEILSQV